jgi:sulfoxide reductase catalytic subunit YedY
MTQRRTYDIDPDEITPEHLYMSRRKFIKGLGALAATAVTLGACAPEASPSPTTDVSTVEPATPSPDEAQPSPSPSALPTAAPFPTLSADQDERGDELTTEKAVNSYNNYYEFSLGKQEVAQLSSDFVTSPWSVAVGGLVAKPQTFSLNSLLAFTQHERIYRMRCVEAWSMVIPWIGFPLAELLRAVEPTPEAKYVRFETLHDPEQMPGQRSRAFEWPYVEGLRFDEAMHDLTILATGLYAKPLTPQTGAPIRLVVPWKYGFKSIKSIVKIDLVEEMPLTMWTAQSPREYGFYANVNPNVSHPRWSQSTERRIGETGRRETTMFNGYEAQVAHLYEGMDLTKWF